MDTGMGVHLSVIVSYLVTIYNNAVILLPKRCFSKEESVYVV